MATALLPKRRFCSANDTLTSGIVKSDSSKPILSKFQHYSKDGITYQLAFATNTLSKAQASDAARGFGEHLFTLPAALVLPICVAFEVTSLCPTGLSATAGEVGFGTTIASGAIATLGDGSAAMENIAEGTTISNHVAGTTLVSEKAGFPVALFDHGATTPGAPGLVDASAGTTKVHFNMASTWNQTAAESVSFSVKGIFTYMILGADYGVEQ